jgi:hypothetical protein
LSFNPDEEWLSVLVCLLMRFQSRNAFWLINSSMSFLDLTRLFGSCCQTRWVWKWKKWIGIGTYSMGYWMTILWTKHTNGDKTRQIAQVIQKNVKENTPNNVDKWGRLKRGTKHKSIVWKRSPMQTHWNQKLTSDISNYLAWLFREPCCQRPCARWARAW